MKSKLVSAGMKFASILAVGLSLVAGVGVEGARACGTNNSCADKSGK